MTRSSDDPPIMRRDGRAARRQAGLKARLGAERRSLVQFSVAKLSPGCGEGAAELGDRLGSNTVHPGEIGLGPLGELLKGDTPGRGQCLPSWPSQAGGQARGLAGSLPGHAVTRSARWERELPRWSGGNGGNPMCWRSKLGTADQS